MWEKPKPIKKFDNDLESLHRRFKHLEEIVIPKYKYQAVCLSEECGSKTNGKIKNVKRFEFSCPDCDHALFWKRLTI